MALGWVIFKFRASGKRATYSEGNNKLEVLWTAAAALLFIGAVLMSTRIFAGVHLTPIRENAMKIELVGKQFQFSFRYPGLDGKFGKTNIKLINDAAGNPFGVDDTDMTGRDDIQAAQLRVPVGVPIVLHMKSRDVIHNFFVRELRIKQDLVPGMEIPLQFVADTPGTYEIPCSELCGLGHHQMRSTLIVMPKPEFDAWMAEEDKKLKALYQ
jgi:cytochrome c oxidase subunit 2